MDGSTKTQAAIHNQVNQHGQVSEAAAAQNIRCVPIPSGLTALLGEISHEIIYNDPQNTSLYLAKYFEEQLNQRKINNALENNDSRASEPHGFLKQLQDAIDGKQIPFDAKAKEITMLHGKNAQGEETKVLRQQKSYFYMPCGGDTKCSKPLSKKRNETIVVETNREKIDNLVQPDAANSGKSAQLESGDNGSQGQGEDSLGPTKSQASVDEITYASVQSQCDLDTAESLDQDQPTGLNMKIDLQNLLPRNYFQVPFLRKAPGMCVWWPLDLNTIE